MGDGTSEKDIRKEDMKSDKRPKPIHCLQKRGAKKLIGKQILYANEKLGLGFYGILEGFSAKTEKFIVQPDHFDNRIECNWIVEYVVGNKL